VIEDPACPVCDLRTWRELGRHTYRRNEQNSKPAYIRNRYRAIFEVLRPGSDEFEIASQLCSSCGFVLHTPRQTSADRSAVYGFLGSLADNAPSSPHRADREQQRARRLYKRIGALKKGASILDYGGSDGRLLRDFVAGGATCHVIDYRLDPIEGVVRIGQDENDIPQTGVYNAVICSHVLEHLAEPLQVLQALALSLRPGGILYAEVPMEIWRRPPEPKEPITHVNYFTPATLGYLLGRAGLEVRSTRLISYAYGSGASALAVECIGVKQPARSADPPGSGETESFLHPGLALTLKRAWLMPGTVARNVMARSGANR
jgi:hypothetical protein